MRSSKLKILRYKLTAAKREIDDAIFYLKEQHRLEDNLYVGSVLVSDMIDSLSGDSSRIQMYLDESADQDKNATSIFLDFDHT